MKKCELLCPVGNYDMLVSAINNGCDAVYLAGKSYGARKFSNNFTNEELKDAIRYSHLYGVLVYVTVNTLIYDYEIDDFLEYIGFLHDINVDALIIQDIGIIKLIRDKFPDMEIHASTQCHNHNEEGIKLLKDLGCQRVVMAREMSLSEINNINVDIEKEVFVYGALCVCYSGCCLFSSLNGGRSGNRGECVGCCRLQYKLVKNDEYVDTQDEYLLSTKDLFTLDHIKELLDSHIDCFKIEGRMKSPAYVGYVTRLYRILIDKYYNHEELTITNEEIENLKLLFNREFTKGFLFNSIDIANIKSPNHQGLEIGKVIKIDNKKIYLKLDHDLHQEDGIRFKNANEGMIVNRLYDKSDLLTNKVLKNNICSIDNKIGLNNLDTVLKTVSKDLIEEIDNYPPKRIKVNYTGKFILNKNFSITMSDGLNEITEYGSIVSSAINREVDQENIIKQLSKLGNTPFIMDNCTIQKDDNIFVNLKDINDTRRKLVDRLINLRENSKRRNIILKDNNILNNNYVYDNKVNINVLVKNEEQLKACMDNHVDNIYIDSFDLYNKYKHDNTYYVLDRVNNHYQDITNSNLLVSEIGSINKYKNNNKLAGDMYLNVTNSSSLEYISKLGVARVCLSVELDTNKIKDLIQKNKYNIEVFIYGRVDLMITKYCLIKKVLGYCNKCNQKNDKFYLEDKNKNLFPIITKNCLNHILSNNINHIDEYMNIGIKNYRINLFDEDYLSTDKIIKEVISKVSTKKYE